MLSERVPELQYEEEKGSLKVLQFGSIGWTKLGLHASSYDAAVATSAVDNVDKSLPVTNEKSCEQETEDDTFSMCSTIDFHYSEEGYSGTDEEYDEDEDNEEEEGMTDSTATAANKEDEALTEWVASWKVPDQPQGWTWIFLYAYFRKEHRDGGYGVLIRNALAKPIIGLTRFSENGVSFFYQVLLGINAGVALAEKHKLSDLRVRCNSIKVPALFSHARHCPCSDPCKGCKNYINYSEGCTMSLLPLVVELKGKNLVNLLYFPNTAAHYLAKMGKWNKRLGEIRPDDFPQELKSILWLLV